MGMKINEEEIKRELREAFGLGESDVTINKVTSSSKMRELGLSDSDFSSGGICWEVVYNHHPKSFPVNKFDLDRLNALKQPLVLRNWFFDCGIVAQKKEVKFPIMFSMCHANLENNSSTSFFSFQDFKFEKDVIFSGIEFADVFGNTQFNNVTFRNQSKWWRHEQEKKELTYFSFDGISVKKKLVLQDLEFSKGNQNNKTEGDFSKLKTLKEMHIINCIFQEEVGFNGLALDTLTLSGVEFEERVSFVVSEIKELAVHLFDDRRPLKNTVFSKLCLFKSSNIGSLEFGDGIEFENLTIQDTTISERLLLHAHMKGILKISAQEEQNASVDFSHSIFEKSIEIDSKITLLSPKFCSCIFKELFIFENFNCEGEIDFSNTTFEDEVLFGVDALRGKKKEVEQKLVFSRVTFKKRADFKNLIFTQDANFSNARFEDNVYFNNSEFKNEADFHESEYGRVACFYGVMFDQIPNFGQALFRDNANFVNTELDYSFDEVEDFLYKKTELQLEKNLREKDLKREKKSVRTKIARDYRDSFRLLKKSMKKEENSLDASNFHKYELYCNEVELDGFKDWGRELKTERDARINSGRIAGIVEKYQLAFYRNLCDHHTNLFKIVNNLMILVTLFAVFVLVLKELFPIGDDLNRVGEMFYETTAVRILDILRFVEIRDILIEYSESAKLYFSKYGEIMLWVCVFLLSVCVEIKVLNHVCCTTKLHDFDKDETCGMMSLIWKNTRITLWEILKLIFILLVSFLLLIVCILAKKAYSTFFISLLFVALFIWLISLRSLFARYLIVLVAYFGFFHTLCNQPSFINPFIGGLFNGDKKLPVIFQNPIFIVLAIVYSFLMFLLLFSLQKTARKNSIIPS